MKPIKDFTIKDVQTAWCPGCGNFMILKAIQKALTELSLNPQQVVLVSGIGQAAKMPHYLHVNMLNGLHGRALPPATAIKACHPQLTVIAEGGDGDMYGEGGNHFLHTIRRNPDIVHLVHNNMVYGLTKGQASPTSQLGFETPVQTEGVILEPLNPLAVAIALGASFVARVFCGDIQKTVSVIKAAIEHPGYALVDIFQPCVTFNKVNTFKWFKEQTYDLQDHNPGNRQNALALAFEAEPFPLGIFYRQKDKPTFEQQLPAYQDGKKNIVQTGIDQEKIRKLIESKRN